MSNNGGLIMNVARWQAKMRAMFGLVDSVTRVEGMIQPVALVEGERFESAFPGNEFHRIQGAIVAAGGVGFSSEVALLNPAQSGVNLVVVATNHAHIVSGRAMAASVIQGTHTLQPSGVPRDFRASGGGGAGQLWTRNTAAPPVEQFRIHTGFNNLLPLACFLISQAQALNLWNSTLNTLSEITYFWFDYPVTRVNV